VFRVVVPKHARRCPADRSHFAPEFFSSNASSVISTVCPSHVHAVDFLDLRRNFQLRLINHFRDRASGIHLISHVIMAQRHSSKKRSAGRIAGSRESPQSRQSGDVMRMFLMFNSAWSIASCACARFSSLIARAACRSAVRTDVQFHWASALSLRRVQTNSFARHRATISFLLTSSSPCAPRISLSRAQVLSPRSAPRRPLLLSQFFFACCKSLRFC